MLLMTRRSRHWFDSVIAAMLGVGDSAGMRHGREEVDTDMAGLPGVRVLLGCLWKHEHC